MNRTASNYILIFLLCRLEVDGVCGVGLTTNEERQKKLVLMHQESLCEFKNNLYSRWKKILVGGIQKTLYGGRNTDNLIESTWFYLKINWVHVFCDNDRSKLVPESTWPGGFPSWTVFDNLKKSEYLTLERKVNVFQVYSDAKNYYYDDFIKDINN